MDKRTLYYHALKALQCTHTRIAKGVYDVKGKVIDGCKDCGMTLHIVPCRDCGDQADFQKTRGNFYCYPCRDRERPPREPYVPWNHPLMIQNSQEQQKFFRKKKGHRKGRRAR